jgi:hypothetical protein
MANRAEFVAFFVLNILLITGCASYKYGRIDTLSVVKYQIRTMESGISVAADPYDSSTKAKKGFYVDVTKENFYPVHLIFQNNTDYKIMFRRETIVLIDANDNRCLPTASKIMSDTCQHNKMAYALLGFGIFSYMSAEEANRKMESDWREKEIPEMLYLRPGMKKDGFVYFELPEGKTTKGCKLKLEIDIPETGKIIPIELDL